MPPVQCSLFALPVVPHTGNSLQGEPAPTLSAFAPVSHTGLYQWTARSLLQRHRRAAAASASQVKAKSSRGHPNFTSLSHLILHRPSLNDSFWARCRYFPSFSLGCMAAVHRLGQVRLDSALLLTLASPPSILDPRPQPRPCSRLRPAEAIAWLPRRLLSLLSVLKLAFALPLDFDPSADHCTVPDRFFPTAPAISSTDRDSSLARCSTPMTVATTALLNTAQASHASVLSSKLEFRLSRQPPFILSSLVLLSLC